MTVVIHGLGEGCCCDLGVLSKHGLDSQSCFCFGELKGPSREGSGEGTTEFDRFEYGSVYDLDVCEGEGCYNHGVFDCCSDALGNDAYALGGSGPRFGFGKNAMTFLVDSGNGGLELCSPVEG